MLGAAAAVWAGEIAATLPPAAQIARDALPDAAITCLVPRGDPHLARLTPSAAARVRQASMLVALGAIDAGWRPSHPRTIVLFPDDPHGWLDPAKARAAIARLAGDPHEGGIVDAELARWRAALDRAGVRKVVLQHAAWRAWFKAAGVQVAAVLDAHGLGAHRAHALTAALDAARRAPRGVLLVAEPGRPRDGLDWLAARISPSPPIVVLDAVGRCDESWSARMARARAAIEAIEAWTAHAR